MLTQGPADPKGPVLTFALRRSLSGNVSCTLGVRRI